MQDDVFLFIQDHKQKQRSPLVPPSPPPPPLLCLHRARMKVDFVLDSFELQLAVAGLECCQ